MTATAAEIFTPDFVALCVATAVLALIAAYMAATETRLP